MESVGVLTWLVRASSGAEADHREVTQSLVLFIIFSLEYSLVTDVLNLTDLKPHLHTAEVCFDKP